MRTKRILAAILALVGLLTLLSIPSMVATHLQRTASGPPRSMANGTVVAEERKGESYEVFVEFSPSPGRTERFRSDPGGARDPEGVSARQAMKVGDSVLVAYDPKDPSQAEVTSVRPLWLPLVRRTVAGGLCLMASLIVLLSARRR
jgi:hypothetical protein